MESIATIKARLLVKNLNPAYPLNIKWFVAEVLDKPVEIHQTELDPRCSALVIDKPHYDFIHIGVNKYHPRTRQRFATLHEIGQSTVNIKEILVLLKRRKTRSYEKRQMTSPPNH
ncbi:MAG: hypothetical protein FH756_05155 [Firmicutes bacterium]|nr:hypothetical protein [Bacillota bacterium]